MFCVEGFNSQEVKAESVPSLHAGQSNSMIWTLSPGNYVLEASTFLGLGDVDVEIYDPAGRRFAVGNRLGDETINFNVPQGAGGDFRVRYSMFLCVNPAGACAVNIDITRR